MKAHNQFSTGLKQRTIQRNPRGLCSSLFLVAVLVYLINCVSFAEEALTFKNSKEKLSYALGVNYAERCKKFAVELDPEILLRGYKDAFAGHTALPDREVQAMVSTLEKSLKSQW